MTGKLPGLDKNEPDQEIPNHYQAKYPKSVVAQANIAASSGKFNLSVGLTERDRTRPGGNGLAFDTPGDVGDRLLPLPNWVGL